MLKKLSQNRNNLRTPVERIKQTIEKVLHEDTSLKERISAWFCECSIAIMSIFTALSMTFSTIVRLSITDVFGGGGGTVDTLFVFVGNVVGATLSFHGKAVGFVAEHT